MLLLFQIHKHPPQVVSQHHQYDYEKYHLQDLHIIVKKSHHIEYIHQ